MKVTVEFASVITAIRPELPATAGLDLPEDATVGDALAAMGVPEGLSGIILVNDKVCGPAMSLSDGDRILILPPVSGG